MKSTLLLLGALGLIGMVFVQAGAQNAAKRMTAKNGENTGIRISEKGYDLTPPSPDRLTELARELQPAERNVILEKGTEKAFSSPLLKTADKGVFACRLCGLPLFAAETKFKSGTGWPSFFQTFGKGHVHTHVDTTFGMVRKEVTCGRCNGHLGHVFDDGPQPTGLRYCVNGVSLKFLKEGSTMPESSQPMKTEVAYFAGGCFWGVEDRFQQIPGVIDAVSGYQGGTQAKPTYRQVCSGSTGHAESVRVDYDPTKVTYEQLLEAFFTFHDPTQLNRQGVDFGTQYRSAIFTVDDDQLAKARAFVKAQRSSERFADKEIVTQVAPAAPFYEAEEYHQDYHAKNGGSCKVN